MRKVTLAVVLSLLVSAQLLASPHKVPRRPSTKAVSPISRVWAQIRSFIGSGRALTGDGHTLPPPPSPLIAGS